MAGKAGKRSHSLLEFWMWLTWAGSSRRREGWNLYPSEGERISGYCTSTVEKESRKFIHAREIEQDVEDLHLDAVEAKYHPGGWLGLFNERDNS